jgi:hypothetical protein
MQHDRDLLEALKWAWEPDNSVDSNVDRRVVQARLCCTIRELTTFPAGGPIAAPVKSLETLVDEVNALLTKLDEVVP